MDEVILAQRKRDSPAAAASSRSQPGASCRSNEEERSGAQGQDRDALAAAGQLHVHQPADCRPGKVERQLQWNGRITNFDGRPGRVIPHS